MNIGSISVNGVAQKTVEQQPAKKPAESVANVAKNVARVVSSASQEALETAAQTRKEAATGDQQAVRKLARDQAAAKSNVTPQPAVSKGMNVIA